MRQNIHSGHDAYEPDALQYGEGFVKDHDAENNCDDDVQVRQRHHQRYGHVVECEAIEERTHARQKPNSQTGEDVLTCWKRKPVAKEKCNGSRSEAAGTNQRVELEVADPRPAGFSMNEATPTNTT